MSAALARWPARARWALTAVLGLGLPLRTAPAQPRLFRSFDTLSVTLRTDLHSLLRDRDTANAPWREARITYAGPDSLISVPLRVRTRGLYRRLHCDIPPIRLRFRDSTARGTLFHGLGRPKLVVPCKNNPEFEQYVLEEYAIYRVLGLVTPVSLSARLLRVTFEDASGRTAPVTRYAFVTEDPARFAERLNGTFVTTGTVGNLSESNLALLGVFEYFVGNTDWSLPGRHNIMLMRASDTTLAVPFDFDWSGVINPPYCRPSQILRLVSCRDRIYRGLCQPREALEPALAKFEAVRDTIAAIYRSIPGLEPRNVEPSLRYYEEFYRAIGDRQRFQSRVVERDCIP